MDGRGHVKGPWPDFHKKKVGYMYIHRTHYYIQRYTSGEMNSSQESVKGDALFEKIIGNVQSLLDASLKASHEPFSYESLHAS